MRIRKKTWARPELEQCGYFCREPQEQRGKWQRFFAEKRSLHLDLGCGKGVFLARIAHQNPNVNYAGVDISYDILGVARRNIEKEYGADKTANVAILSYDIEKLTDVFSNTDGVERIYINFCNPWPKARAHRKRLTHTSQLGLYKKILQPGGEIWFKTDNDDLYLASLRYFKEAGLNVFFHTVNLHEEKEAENILSEHEIMFTAQGITTKAIRAGYCGGEG